MNSFSEPLYSQKYVDQGEGETVILLHGLFGNITMWRNTVTALQEHYRVIIPRLPFFEDSIYRTDVRHLVSVLHEFIEWHQLSDVTLVATDLGGQVALFYAHSHPDVVRRVVLSGSAGLAENITSWDNGYRNVDEQVRRAFYKDEYATFGVVNDVYKTVNTAIKGLHVKFFTQSSRQNDVSSFLKDLSLPVLLIWGLQDQITTPEVGLQFHDMLPNGMIRFIDECGHLPMVEQPVNYADHIRQFMIEVS